VMLNTKGASYLDLTSAERFWLSTDG
jgi:hypothetical protein